MYTELPFDLLRKPSNRRLSAILLDLLRLRRIPMKETRRQSLPANFPNAANLTSGRTEVDDSAERNAQDRILQSATTATRPRPKRVPHLRARRLIAAPSKSLQEPASTSARFVAKSALLHRVLQATPTLAEEGISTMARSRILRKNRRIRPRDHNSYLSSKDTLLTS